MYYVGRFLYICGYAAVAYKMLSGLPHLDLLKERPLRKKRDDTFLFSNQRRAPAWTAFQISSGAKAISKILPRTEN